MIYYIYDWCIKTNIRKAHWRLKLNPDEQRRFLGTFEERVSWTTPELATANDDKFQKAFLTILETFKKETEPLFVKISPQVVFEKQVYYLKQAKDADCQATIVSEDHNSSPFGLVIHSDVRFKQVKKTSERPFQIYGKRKRRKLLLLSGKNGLVNSISKTWFVRYLQLYFLDKQLLF